MSRRHKHRYEVKEVDFTPAPIKKNTWAEAWMDYIIWGEEGESGVMAKLGERV